MFNFFRPVLFKNGIQECCNIDYCIGKFENIPDAYKTLPIDKAFTNKPCPSCQREICSPDNYDKVSNALPCNLVQQLRDRDFMVYESEGKYLLPFILWGFGGLPPILRKFV